VIGKEKKNVGNKKTISTTLNTKVVPILDEIFTSEELLNYYCARNKRKEGIFIYL
jgi:hypothetical protein